MQVRIVVAGLYSKSVPRSNGIKMSAARYVIGDIIDVPKWYAESLVESRLAMKVLDDEPVPAAAPAVPVDIDATPAAARLAEEYELPLDRILGTGEDGRILKSDVQAIVDDRIKLIDSAT